MKYDEQEELLLELITTKYWKALKVQVDATLEQYRARLMAPATSEFDLIRKETISARYDGLSRFFSEVERIANRKART
jgi:hypothetical protein